MPSPSCRSIFLAALVGLVAGPGRLCAQSRPVSHGPTPAGDHSSDYFARGFDLNLGPDFAIAMEGIPLNVPSALKAPGFFDDGILIPETMSGLRYRRGPYRSDQGAFAIAGSAELEAVATFERPMAKVTYGGAETDRFGRLLWADTRTGSSTCTYALEATRSYRPWNEWDPSSKLNAFLRITPREPARGWTFTLLATREKGDGGAPPLDASQPKSFPADDDPRLGDGYFYQRVFLGLNRAFDRGAGVTDQIQFYGGAATLQNWLTSTYFLRDNFWGDQVEMRDRRVFLGGEAWRQWERQTGGLDWTHRAGVQARVDQVGDASIEATFDRGPFPLAPTFLDARATLAHGTLYGQSTARWGQGWHAFVAARVDTQGNRVYGPLADPRQDRWATLVSPRLGMGYSPWEGTQIRAAWGQGFRLGNAFRDTRPMVRAHSADLGLQTRLVEPWTTSFTFWRLDLEAEAVFDAPKSALVLGAPSRRQGLEWFNEVKWGPWSVEACLAWSKARFSQAPLGQDRVPGSIPQTGLLKVSWKTAPLGASLSFRSFGAFAVEPGNTLISGRQNALSMRLERNWKDWSAALEVSNAFNLRKNKTAYYYESQFPNESAAFGTHTRHPDRQAIRVELCHRF